jgi:hypothetical protein
MVRSTLGLAFASFTVGFASYRFVTYGQTFQAFDDETDSLAQSTIAKSLNPYGNKTLSDIYLARVPLERIDPDLIRNGGEESSKLVERYAAGLLGGWGQLPCWNYQSLH